MSPHKREKKRNILPPPKMSSHILTANELILQRLAPFYENESNMNKFLKCINQQYIFSLRHVDWFVTNYAKKYFTIIHQVSTGGETNRFKVYSEYKQECKSYSKRKFDPFCRNERISIPYPSKPDVCIQTTIGQLNFFEWAIRNQLVEYIVDHYQEIDNDMHERNSISKKSKSKKKSAASSSVSLSSVSSLDSTSCSSITVDEPEDDPDKEEEEKSTHEAEEEDSHKRRKKIENEDLTQDLTRDLTRDLTPLSLPESSLLLVCQPSPQPASASSSTSSFLYSHTNNITKKGKKNLFSSLSAGNQKTRKKREELSVSAIKSLKKEMVEVLVRFDS